MARTVLLLHSSAGGYGADRQLHAIATGLDPTRYRPVVVLPEEGELLQALQAGGVDARVEPLAVLRRSLVSPAGAIRLARAARRDRSRLGEIVRRERAALVHSNTSVVLAAGTVASASGIPHVVHVREIYRGAGGAAGRAGWPVLRRRIERADAVVCVSHAVAGQFRDAAPTRVVYDGLLRVPRPVPSVAARAVLGIPRSGFVVALLGRISDWKGQDVLARALAEPPLAEIGAIGAIVGAAYPGREDARRRLERLRDRLDLRERLLLLGYRRDVDTVLGAANVVAVPSTRPDPLPNSALEAAAGGVPLVGSAAGGLPEIIRDGETGTLVPPGDHRALATALRRIADDRVRARQMADRAMREAAERFALERMLAEMHEVYDSVAGRRAGGT